MGTPVQNETVATAAQLTAEAALARMDTLQAQITRMAEGFDALYANVEAIKSGNTGQGPFVIDAMKAQIDALSAQIQGSSNQPFNRSNNRWDWRKLRVDKFKGTKSEWRGFAFSIKSFIRREAPTLERLLIETEHTPDAIPSPKFQEYGVSKEDDAELFWLLVNYTEGTAK